MAGAVRRLPPPTSRPKGSGVLLLMMSVQLVAHVAGSSLCDRCETEEVRGLRRYYLGLNLSSVYNIITSANAMLCFRRCLLVCLSVSNFAQNLPNGFARNFQQGRLTMGQ